MNVKFTEDNFKRLIAIKEHAEKLLAIAYTTSRSTLKDIKENIDSLDTTAYAFRNTLFENILELEKPYFCSFYKECIGRPIKDTEDCK